MGIYGLAEALGLAVRTVDLSPKYLASFFPMYTGEVSADSLFTLISRTLGLNNGQRLLTKLPTFRGIETELRIDLSMTDCSAVGAPIRRNGRHRNSRTIY